MSDRKKIDTFGEGISLSSGDSHNTMQGAVPGSVSTAGQFQVWAKMSVNQLKSDQRNILNKLDDMDKMVCNHEVLLEKTVDKDDGQEKMLNELKVKVEDQGLFVTAMRKSHKTSIKILTMVGGSLLSVLGSLLIWMLTKR
jgi:Zn-dependent M16 (insulinase) family peptidase